jgi:hypothetical protein
VGRAFLHNYGAKLPTTSSSATTTSSTMISGILIFNQKGENLIFRSFRSDCRPRLADIFRIQVISNVNVRSPILTLGSTTFSHIRHENIYLVAISKGNANAAVIFEFLERVRGLGKAYFGKFDEEAVKNNFVLVYELLDGELNLLLTLLLWFVGHWGWGRESLNTQRGEYEASILEYG